MLRTWVPMAVVAGSLLLGAAGGASADRCDRNYDSGYRFYQPDRSGLYDRNNGWYQQVRNDSGYRYDRSDRNNGWYQQDRNDRGYRYGRDDRNYRREELQERRARARRFEERRENDRRDRFHSSWNYRGNY
jgi:hypothetical protein